MCFCFLAELLPNSHQQKRTPPLFFLQLIESPTHAVVGSESERCVVAATSGRSVSASRCFRDRAVLAVQVQNLLVANFIMMR